MDYPLLLRYLKRDAPFFHPFPAKEIACSICLIQSIKYWYIVNTDKKSIFLKTPSLCVKNLYSLMGGNSDFLLTFRTD
jgi:hypothetical protein